MQLRKYTDRCKHQTALHQRAMRFGSACCSGGYKVGILPLDDILKLVGSTKYGKDAGFEVFDLMGQTRCLKISMTRCQLTLRNIP